MTCRALAIEMIRDAVDTSNTRVCKDYVEMVTK